MSRYCSVQCIQWKIRQAGSSSHDAHILTGKRDNKQANKYDKSYFHNAEEKPWNTSLKLI